MHFFIYPLQPYYIPSDINQMYIMYFTYGMMAPNEYIRIYVTIEDVN
jgi:hypothetical protein